MITFSENAARPTAGRQAYLDGKPRDWVLSTSCTDTATWQAEWDAAADQGLKDTTPMEIDRKAIATAVAKAIAYKQCGKDDEANIWARELVEQLHCTGILCSKFEEA